jgi:hypothetical protein
VIVRVDEARHDRHLMGIECLRARTNQRLDIVGTPNGDEPSCFNRKRLRPRRERIDRVDLGVEHDEIGNLSRVNLRSSRARGPGCTDQTGDTGTREPHELSAVKVAVGHRELLKPLFSSPARHSPVKFRIPVHTKSKFMISGD